MCGGASSGVPPVNGGAGAYSGRVDRLGGVFAVQFGDQRQREIDAGGNAAAADHVAVALNACSAGDGAEQRQAVAHRPVAGGAFARQQAGGGRISEPVHTEVR